MTEELEDFLAHYGVKGMKWGVRKNKPSRRMLRRAKKIKERREELREASAKERYDYEKKLNQQQALRIALGIVQQRARRKVNDINLDYARKFKAKEMMDAMGGMPVRDIPFIIAAPDASGVYDISSLRR